LIIPSTTTISSNSAKTDLKSYMVSAVMENTSNLLRGGTWQIQAGSEARELSTPTGTIACYDEKLTSTECVRGSVDHFPH
jgi:hypothetical protein